jgi:hypothetical protein
VERLPKAVLAALKLAEPNSRVLGWAETADGYAVALKGSLALGRGTTWELVAWHDIVHGAWNPDTSELSWLDGDGERRAITLAKRRDLPPVFRERVDETFLVEEKLGAGDDTITVSVQQRLGAPGPLVFRATPSSPAAAADPALAAQAAERLAQLQRDLA